MQLFAVIAECVDERDGKRYFAGDAFPGPGPFQLERLKRAGCLGDEIADLEVEVTITPPDDGLEDMTIAELREHAAKTSLDLGPSHLKAEIIETIRRGAQLTR